jgi:hypothetical protein
LVVVVDVIPAGRDDPRRGVQVEEPAQPVEGVDAVVAQLNCLDTGANYIESQWRLASVSASRRP